MNNVNLMGNLARDPEVRYTKTGRAVATFTVAASNTYIDANTKEAKEQSLCKLCSLGNISRRNRDFTEGK